MLEPLFLQMESEENHRSDRRSNVSVAPAFSVDSGVAFTLHEVSLTIGNDSSVNFGMPAP